MTDSEGPLGQFFAGRLICVLAAGSYKKEDWRVSRPLTSWTESMYVDTQGNARLPPYSHKCIHCGNIFTFNNSLKDLRKLMQHHVLPPSSLNVHVGERKSGSIINVDTQVSARFTTINLWFATLTDTGQWTRRPSGLKILVHNYVNVCTLLMAIKSCYRRQTTAVCNHVK